MSFRDDFPFFGKRGHRPPHITANPIYSQFYDLVYEPPVDNANILVVGNTGSGKTRAAIRWAYDLDPTFNLERICFTLTEFLNLLKNGDRYGKLKPGSCVVLDELVGSEMGADSRSFMSKENKTYGFLVTTFRVLGLITFYCSPFKGQMDSNLRKVGVKAILKCKKENIDVSEKLNKVELLWVEVDPLTDFETNPRPRIYDPELGMEFFIESCRVPLPPSWYDNAYEFKKNTFLFGNIDRWAKKFAQEEKSEKLDKKQYKLGELYEAGKSVLPKVVKRTRKGEYRVVAALLKWELQGAPQNLLTVIRQKLEHDLNSGVLVIKK